jgi:hypothetical protein
LATIWAAMTDHVGAGLVLDHHGLRLIGTRLSEAWSRQQAESERGTAH